MRNISHISVKLPHTNQTNNNHPLFMKTTLNPLLFLKRSALAAMLATMPAVATFAAQTQQAPVEKASSDGSSDAADLAKKLQNPISSMVSVPFQSNFDFGGGYDGKAFRYNLKLQPVVPIPLSEDYNLIVRPILPIVYQDGVFPDATIQTAREPEARTISGTQSGLSDMLIEVFVSPSNPLPGGIIAGVGPVILLPTATETVLGTGKYGLGPTGVILRQDGGLAYGALAYQLWSVAGDSDRQNVSSLYVQPFVSYTTKTATTFAIDLESSYDWQREGWTVPGNAMVSQILKVGKLPVSFQIGARYYFDAPDHGPDWGLRFTITPLLPGF